MRGAVFCDGSMPSLAESAVNSVIAKRMVKKQQMRWSLHGVHMLMQVRTAEMNSELRDRLRARFRAPEPSVPSLFKPKPPLLCAAYKLNANSQFKYKTKSLISLGEKSHL